MGCYGVWGLNEMGMWRMFGVVMLAGVCAAARAAGTKPVPSSCTAAVNSGLAQFVSQNQGTSQSVHQDNVMVCGVMQANSIPQHAGHSGAGAHHVLVVSAPAGSGTLQVEVVTNDQLDGVVAGNKGDQVYAYGQAYVDPGTIHVGAFTVAAGVHEPHCATHAGADDGWVMVAGKRYPRGGCPVGAGRARSRHRRR